MNVQSPLCLRAKQILRGVYLFTVLADFAVENLCGVLLYLLPKKHFLQMVLKLDFVDW